MDGGDTRADSIELYSGPAYGLQLGMVLLEYDYGDPDAYRDEVDAAVKSASGIITAAVTAGGGPVAGLAVGTALGAAGPALTSAINDALDTDDDLIGSSTVFLDRARLHALTAAPYQHDDDMEYRFEGPLLSGEGASYKVRFDVMAI